MAVPLGRDVNGLKLISTPKMGYLYSTYNRKGFNRKDYKGTVERRIFGLTNEARYPLSLHGWSVEPAVEFNLMSYGTKGGENQREYSLDIKSQNNYSAELGFGLYAHKEIPFSQHGKLTLTNGVAVYHEFADPYALELGMNGMNGSFKIRDEHRRDNRAVARAGFDYQYQNTSLYGKILSYFDGQIRSDFNLGLKFGF